MRSVIRNSENLEISIQKEIEHLTVYLDLEKMRFENSFEYEIVHEKELAFLDNKIPLMLIQPLLENAVWHGFKDIDYKGKIWIRFKRSGNGFRIEVEDNGKGISEKAQTKLHESKGLNMLNEKIAVSNSMFDYKITFELINKAKKDHGVLGIFDIIQI